MRKGEGIQFSVKAPGLREGKWVGGEKRGELTKGMLGWPWSWVFSRWEGRSLVNSFGLAHFKAATLAKCSSLFQKKEALALGNRLTETLQKAMPTSLVLGYVLPPFQLGDSSTVNLTRESTKGFLSLSVLVLLTPALASISFPPLCCSGCGRRHLPGRLVLSQVGRKGPGCEGAPRRGE